MRLLCHLSYTTKQLLDIRNHPSVPPSAGSKLTAYEWKPPKIKVNLLSNSVPWNKCFMWNKLNINGAGKNLVFKIICTFFSSVSVSAQSDWMFFWFAALCRVELQAFQCGLTPLPAPLHLTELQQKMGALSPESSWGDLEVVDGMTDASERLLEVSGCSVEHRGSLSGVPRSCSGSSLGMGFLGQPAGCQWLLPSPKFLFLRTEARGIALKPFESFSAL